MLIPTLNSLTILAGMATMACNYYKIKKFSLCRSGAAIVTEMRNTLSGLNKQFFNPICFLQYHNSLVPFSEVNDDEVSGCLCISCTNTICTHRSV